MKSTELKSMIKEAVKEAIGEELREILLEAVKRGDTAPQTVNESATQMRPVDTTASKMTKEKYASLLSGMAPGADSISMNSSHAQGFAAPAYNPGGANTTGQGSALPPGEVNMNQIMGLINKK